MVIYLPAPRYLFKACIARPKHSQVMWLCSNFCIVRSFSSSRISSSSTSLFLFLDGADGGGLVVLRVALTGQMGWLSGAESGVDWGGEGGTSATNRLLLKLVLRNIISQCHSLHGSSFYCTSSSFIYCNNLLDGTCSSPPGDY